jgi:hypothetical protein
MSTSPSEAKRSSERLGSFPRFLSRGICRTNSGSSKLASSSNVAGREKEPTAAASAFASTARLIVWKSANVRIHRRRVINAMCLIVAVDRFSHRLTTGA